VTAATIDPRIAPQEAAAPAAVRGFWRTWLLDTPEVVTLAVVSLVGYLIAAWVFRYQFGYVVNDALARTAKPIYMALSRDPHFGAVGFYWPPLPSTMQIPLVILLRPFGHMDFAGPISSAVWAALAGVVLGRICREQGLGRPLTFVICILFLANPAIFVYAINGMSESCLYFFLLVVMLGWLRWVRRRGIADIALIGAGMAAAVLVRIESAPVAVVLAVLVGAGRDWKNWITRGVTTLIPPVFSIACWLATQWILLGDPLAFLHFNTGQNGVRRSAAFLARFGLPQASHDYAVALVWAGAWLIVLAPMLAALTVAGIARPRRFGYTAAGIVGTALVFPLVQVYLLVHDTGYGDPRYFTGMVPLGFVAAVVLAANFLHVSSLVPPVFARPNALPEPKANESVSDVAVIKPTPRRLIVAPLTVLSLAAVGAATLAYMDNHRRTNIGGEHIVYDVLLGKTVQIQHPLDDNRNLARKIDPYLAKGDRIILDTNGNYGAILFSHHPDHFVIQEDRDFRSIVDSPDGRFQLIADLIAPRDVTTDVIRPLITPAASWKPIGDFGPVRVYLYVGAPP
jgi:hypothetical protein